MKIIYSENLHVILREIYHLTATIGFTPEYIEAMVPMERNLYIAYYVDEQRKQEQQSKGEYDVLSADIPKGINMQDMG